MLKNKAGWTALGLLMAGLNMPAVAQTNSAAARVVAPSTNAATPQRVLILGDSMMRLLAHSLERELARQPGVTATIFTSLASGLARLDTFDWLGKMRSEIVEARPDFVIVALGTNDKQAMQVDGGVIVQPGDEAWNKAYAQRLGTAMDILTSGGSRQVLWMELPDMRDARHQADATEINAILRKEAGLRPSIHIFETRALLSRKPGTFSSYLIGRDGMPLAVRENDGIHLSRAGADLAASKLIAAMGFSGVSATR
ncbi:MAG: DUF459 domain-containing protein [bacterium]